MDKEEVSIGYDKWFADWCTKVGNSLQYLGTIIKECYKFLREHLLEVGLLALGAGPATPILDYFEKVVKCFMNSIKMKIKK